MNLLFRLIHASACRSTHHKLALDALRFLACNDATRWQNLLLKYHPEYLRGAKAPDDEFKDFRNHVLHVGDNYWGGAVTAAKHWYARTLDALQRRAWSDAAYSAGVLSHYYTDPIQPFHTGQSTAENNIHRAAEWSICQAYDQLWQRMESSGGTPYVPVPPCVDWLAQMVRAGAEQAHPHYEALIEHYDMARGVANPPQGLDETSRDIVAQLLGYAAAGFARVLDEAIGEAGVAPPDVSLSVETFLATVNVPICWVTKKLADARERALVQAMYAELTATGKVERTLPADDLAVREAHEREVLQAEPTTAHTRSATNVSPPASPALKPAPAPATPRESLPEKPRANTPATANASASPPSPMAPRLAPTKPAALRYHLEPESSIENAPSIGPKTAARLNRVGIVEVDDLLACDPKQTAEDLGAKHISAQTIRDWQDQARLVCQIPNLRGHDAQILVACDCRSAAQVAAEKAETLCAAAEKFARSEAGQRLLRGASPPDLTEVKSWISAASQSRSLRAA